MDQRASSGGGGESWGIYASVPVSYWLRAAPGDVNYPGLPACPEYMSRVGSTHQKDPPTTHTSAIQRWAAAEGSCLRAPQWRCPRDCEQAPTRFAPIALGRALSLLGFYLLQSGEKLESHKCFLTWTWTTGSMGDDFGATWTLASNNTVSR